MGNSSVKVGVGFEATSVSRGKQMLRSIGYSIMFAVTWYTRPPQPSSGNASDTFR
jgi:hypothetical protein